MKTDYSNPIRQFRVALLVETARELGRGLLRGIMRYERLHGPWGMHIIPGDIIQTLPMMHAMGGTGIIARMPTAQIARSVLKAGLPAIAIEIFKHPIAPSDPLSQLPQIRTNGEAIGRMAAEHLLSRGIRHFGFVGDHAIRPWMLRRKQGFSQAVAAAGCRCFTYARPPPSERDWGRDYLRLGKWLQSLPKPAGVMAATDVRGRQVIEACIGSQLRVPEDVAVIGVDNDQLLCELCDPPLSSVALDSEKAGYEAAELLRQMMEGRPIEAREILVEPTHVVERRSTDTAAVEDEKVAAAMRFIRLSASKLLQVTDVSEHVGLSRRALEIRFRRAAGHTILSEIQRTHLNRVKAFLIETDLPIGRVAEQCGYATGNYLGKLFLKKLGVTPQQFRMRNR